MSSDEPQKSEWQTKKHALKYLSRAHKLPHREEGEKVLLEQIPKGVKRVLDLGTGDGRLLSLVFASNPQIKEGVALDFSDPMLTKAKSRLQDDKRISIVKHDFGLPLPKDLGCFDAIVSSLAIHHLSHERKRQLYTEVFDHLNGGGVRGIEDLVALKALGLSGALIATSLHTGKIDVADLQREGLL